MNEKPTVLESKRIYHGWLRLRVDKLKIPGVDKPYDYEIVHIGDGVAVLPFLDPDTLLLSSQYRHPVKKKLLELVQGGISRNESAEDAAKRELLEETGHVGKINHLITIHPLPASLDMNLYIKEATELKKIQEPKNDPLESMDLVKIPYNQVLKEVLSGKHRDSVLAIAILYHYAKTS